MRHRRRTTRLVSVALAGLLALVLTGAQTAPPDVNVGTASTSLIGSEVSVDLGSLGSLVGAGQAPAVDVLDVVTYASNDTDAQRNERGGGSPFALAEVVPLRAAGEERGATSASSDGSGESSSDGASLGALNSATSALGIAVEPVRATASAGVEEARGAVEATTAQLDALLNTIGVELSTETLSSHVTQADAKAVQGIQVSGIDLALGDLVALEVLRQLPLSTVLSLLDQLPVPVPDDVAGTIQQVTQATDAVSGALSQVESAAGAIPGSDALTLLQDAQGALPAVQDLTGLHGQVQGLLDGLSLTSLLSTISSLQGLLGDLGDVGCGVSQTLTGLSVSGLTTILQDTLTCLEGQISDEVSGLPGVSGAPGQVVSDLQSLITEQSGILDGLVGDLQSALDGLVSALTDLSGDAGQLSGILDRVRGLLPDLAGTSLLSIGSFDVGSRAVATGDPATSRAVFGCSPLDVTVMGESFSTPDCSEGLEQIAPVSQAISGALGQVQGVLNALPLGQAVSAENLQLQILPDVVERVTTRNGYVVAEASGTLLDLQIPAVTIDPSQATDLLSGLQLPQVQSTVDGALSQVTSALGPVSGLLDNSVPGTGELSGQLDSLQGVLDGLPLGDFGSLSESFTTPSLQLAFDPGSTAEYRTRAAAAQPEDDQPQPDPVTDDSTVTETRSLPNTGGGFALAGLLAVSGAAALLRRRR